jgi:hypothetical protein
MDGALISTQVLFNLMAGLGLFFMGVGILWFVTVYRDINKKE